MTTKIKNNKTIAPAKPGPADKFSLLFDQDWQNAKSSLRGRFEASRSYDPIYSWDAKVDDPKEFSRLKQTLVPFQPSKPIVMSDAAVITLENTTGLNAINVKEPSVERCKIPLSAVQQDAGIKQDLSLEIPFLLEAKNNNKVPLMKEKPSFKNMYVQAPELVQAEVPYFLTAAGPQCDQKLLNPKQRRDILEFEKKEAEAKELFRQAYVEREKTKKQLTGIQFHRGVLMYDSNDNMNSEIYGERAKREYADGEYKAQIHLERRSRLANKQSSMTLSGNILLPETLGPRVKVNKFYQSKGGDTHALSFDETHNRLFCRMGGSANDGRTQKLRDTESSGIPFNIVNHTIIEHWPPRQFDREYSKTLAHPSQTALEKGTRNLQGTLRPY